MIRACGRRIGFLLDDGGLEERILREGEIFFKEEKPKVMAWSSERADSAWKKVEVLLEPIFSEPTVYIFGAGHVSKQLAPLVKKVHFKVVVIDDREIFANRARFPEADEMIVSEFEKCFDKLNIDESSYLVIVTRGHLYDSFVLEQAVKTNARYIGMIGSRKKIRTLYQNLLIRGVPKEVSDQSSCTHWVEINSETPEEIAVSIVAELIKVKGQPLSVA